ncbi:MAG: DcaP family trimeric outer membrane transporter [Flavobacterium sp.]
MEIYGYIMLDAGYNFGALNPLWVDVLRPTKILNDDGNEFGPKGNVYMGVRQTRLGIKNFIVTGLGELKTHFEFDLFGNGANAGQTTFHFRHAFAELGRLGVGQTNSVFADGDIFPSVLDFWGPNGIVMFRNIQIRYTVLRGEHTKLSFALERPGGSGDQGQYGKGFKYPGNDGELLQGIAFRFPSPDITAEYRHTGKWWYVEVAGILKNIKWTDNNKDQFDLSGETLGWGLNVTSKLYFSKNVVFSGAFVYGQGIQNYMNDADSDLGIKRQYDNTKTPITGEPIPVVSFMSFITYSWNPQISTTVGYSRQDNRTAENQLATAFKSGQYAIGNVLYHPTNNCMVGLELQYGSRQNNDFQGDPFFGLAAEEGNNGAVTKVQLSFKYNFDAIFYRNL